jgi:lysophospholipase L1-like esterase
MLQPGHYTIVCFGDSTTAPREVNGENLVVYADILRKELPKSEITGSILNKGIGGNTTKDAIARFQADVLDQNPNLVILQFGCNDSAMDVWKDPPITEPRVSLSDYISNLQTMIRTLKDRGSQVILMTPEPRRWTPEMLKLYGKAPYDSNDPMGFNVLFTDYIRAVRDIAKKENLGLVDMFETFIACGEKIDSLFLDGVHPNNEGHRLVAAGLLKKCLGPS